MRLAIFALAVAATACAPKQLPVVPAPADTAATARPLVAPDSFIVAFTTSKGRFDVMAHRDWAPLGTQRFYELVRRNYYDDVYFFRAVRNFVVQFGLSGDTAVTSAWRNRRIQDDTIRRSNVRGTLSFARGGANTRTTQLFVNLRDNTRLDYDSGFGFAVFGQVVTGMDVVDSLYMGYGDSAPAQQNPARPDTVRRGPQQARITREGNDYLRKDFPLLDRVITARVVKEWR